MSATARRPAAAPLAVIDDEPGRPTAAAPHDAAIRWDTVTGSSAIDALGAEWTALFRSCGRAQQVFQSFEWLAVWRSVHKGARAAVVTGRDRGRLVFVWPLVIEHRCGLRVLSGMGEPLSQYCDAIVADSVGEVERDAALDQVFQLPVDVVWLRRVRDDAALSAALGRRFGTGIAHQTAPMVDLSGLADIAAFNRRYSGKLRGNRSRRRRRLEEQGALTFDHFGPSPEAAVLVRTALRFKRDWARRRGILAPFLSDPRFEDFFVRAATAAGGIAGLRVSAMRRGPDILGIEISVLCRGSLFGHVLAPNPDHLRFGVGGVLAEMTILNALERRYAAVDLLAPADPYKLEWATASVGVVDYVLPRSVGGRIYARLWVHSGRDLLKRIARRVGPSLAFLFRRVASTHLQSPDTTSSTHLRVDLDAFTEPHAEPARRAVSKHARTPAHPSTRPTSSAGSG